MITFDIKPFPKPRRIKGFKDKRSRQYDAFKKEVILKSNVKGYKLEDSLNIEFVIPIPKSWPKYKKLEMNGKPHQQTPDIDNLVKAWMDALATNDSFVHTVFAKKVWGEKGEIKIHK